MINRSKFILVIFNVLILSVVFVCGCAGKIKDEKKLNSGVEMKKKEILEILETLKIKIERFLDSSSIKPIKSEIINDVQVIRCALVIKYNLSPKQIVISSEKPDGKEKIASLLAPDKDGFELTVFPTRLLEEVRLQHETLEHKDSQGKLIYKELRVGADTSLAGITYNLKYGYSVTPDFVATIVRIIETSQVLSTLEAKFKEFLDTHKIKPSKIGIDDEKTLVVEYNLKNQEIAWPQNDGSFQVRSAAVPDRDGFSIEAWFEAFYTPLYQVMTRATGIHPYYDSNRNLIFKTYMGWGDALTSNEDVGITYNFTYGPEVSESLISEIKNVFVSERTKK